MAAGTRETKLRAAAFRCSIRSFGIQPESPLFGKFALTLSFTSEVPQILLAVLVRLMFRAERVLSLSSA